FLLHADLKPESELVFQDGPVAEYGLNGVTNEEVIEVLIERLNALNQEPFDCYENDMAVSCLKESLIWLNHRAKKREGIKGTP
ncbi:MAG TPA: hypothetical protein VFK47_06850, partial [Ktedonobacteraceae bacterium]|nr:hypothetical protein [Ktedonobacteraceae bacterium]